METRPQSRLHALALGIVFAVLLLELATRVFGWIASPTTRPKAAPLASDFTVLCLGNSFTHGQGAGPGEDYPSQLETLLRRAYPGKRIRVVNRGLGNANTTNVLEILNDSLRDMRPDVVSLMTGQPNHWNLYGYDVFLKRSYPGLPLAQWIYSSLYSSHAFRLATILFHQFPSDETTGARAEPLTSVGAMGAREAADDWVPRVYNTVLAAGDNRTGLIPERLTKAGLLALREALVKLMTRDPRRPVPELLAEIERTLSSPAEGLKWLDRGLDVDPEDFHLDTYVALTKNREEYARASPDYPRVLEKARKRYPGDKAYEAMLQWFEKFPAPAGGPAERIAFLKGMWSARPFALQLSMLLPSEYNRHGMIGEEARFWVDFGRFQPFGVNFGRLSSLEEQTADPRLRRMIEEFKTAFRKNFPREAYRTMPVREEEWIRSDIVEMTRILRDRGIPFILQTYSPHHDGRGRPEDAIIRDIARDGRYPLSDTATEMTEVFRRNPAGADSYYSTLSGPGDDHLSGRGYRFVAELLLKDLARSKLLKKLAGR